ncbi:stage II sporulation protein [Kosmotoga arenicorallina S304]|uniref:Stage II sporulation protein n=1 Tax=Kosmotoga arenicorallina S304 TaxID=1453497 RepID=A0A176JZI3_9BACT|nr:SpoIIE family protein phosphatase [Kosmotoga arenicorallina]OAA29486.1 stage II sporulation protein [Kosmotoga arenicorallina S304]
MLTCEVNYSYKNKGGEEVCGDTIKIKRDVDKTVVSLSDGLGSGVKASILSTLTATMATTMVFNRVPIEEVFSSILSTLPVCKERGISYATLSTFLIDHEQKKCFVVEYEFPVILFFRGEKPLEMKKNKRTIKGKDLFISEMPLEEGDAIFAMTDGVSQAGMGSSRYPFGLGIENIRIEIKNLLEKKVRHADIVNYLINLAKRLDKGTRGDDALAAVLKIRKENTVTIMVGPPEDRSKDRYVVEKLLASPGKKVVCGGTTGQIVERFISGRIDIDLNSISENSPPLGYLRGIDLVTEGIITLTQVFRYLEGQETKIGYGSKSLISMLMEADIVNFIVGRAINPAHQNPLFTHDISLKFRIINDIARILEKMGKIVKIEYY